MCFFCFVLNKNKHYSAPSLVPLAQFIELLSSVTHMTLSCFEPPALNYDELPITMAPSPSWIALLFSASYCTTPLLSITRTFYSYSPELLFFAALNSEQQTSSAIYSYLSLTDPFSSSDLWQPLVTVD